MRNSHTARGAVLAIALCAAVIQLACSSGGSSPGPGSGGAGTGGAAGIAGGGSGGIAGGNGDAASGSGGAANTYGWVTKDPGSGYSIMSIWGDMPNSMWAVDIGGQLLYYDGSSWQVAFGGTLALDSVYGLPGQTTIFLVGAGSQYYQVQGVRRTHEGVFYYVMEFEDGAVRSELANRPPIGERSRVLAISTDRAVEAFNRIVDRLGNTEALYTDALRGGPSPLERV